MVHDQRTIMTSTWEVQCRYRMDVFKETLSPALDCFSVQSDVLRKRYYDMTFVRMSYNIHTRSFSVKVVLAWKLGAVTGIFLKTAANF